MKNMEKMSNFLEAFLEQFKDEDIDVKLIYLSRKASLKLMDVKDNLTDEQKEEINKLFEKIIEIGGIK